MSDITSELLGLRSLDPQAISSIHNQYYPDIYKFARYRLGEESLAEDIAAEVFLKLLEAVHSGGGPDSSLRGWLYATTSHLINDHYRKVYARKTDTSTEDLDEKDHPADETGHTEIIIESLERNTQVRLAIEGLTEEQKQVITLRFGSNYSLVETASVMGKQVNAVKALQFRALGAIRRRIGDLL